MQNKAHFIFHQTTLGLRIAGLLLLCGGWLLLCGTLCACAPAEGSAAYNASNNSNSSNGSSKADAAEAFAVVETLSNLPTLSEGAAATEGSDIWIDYGNAARGYVMVQYLGSNSGMVKVQITGADGITYTYNITALGENFDVLPLTGGDGSYTINTYEQDSGTSYYLIDSLVFDVTLDSQLLPYLTPNQFVNYDETSAAFALSKTLAGNATSELHLVTLTYEAVMDAVDYDYTLADEIAAGGLTSYLPDLDAVLESGTGICFDYAALMVAMLRMQGVPAKLVIGYAGEAYHAWINVYSAETGWVEEVIYFDGEAWTLMDPTFADTTSDKNYVGDGQTYTEKYVY